MQLVTLSTRPEVLAETLIHLRHFMPWLGEVLVITPASRADSFGDLAVEVLTDESLTGLTTQQLRDLDHMSRNFTLRGALAASDRLHDLFLMADDDHRPLKPVAPEFFVDEGRIRSYYFYDLADWPGDDTPFDDGQHHVRELLGYLGYPHLAYGSHQPQAIRRDHLIEAWTLAERLTTRRTICEWSLYANVARALHPDDYHEPEPFRTLCWPQYPNEWPWWVRPTEFVFENFYPELYQPGHLFDGLPTELDPATAERTNVEKIIRWSDLGRRTARLDFPDDIANPWTQDSKVRERTFKALRRLRKAYDYVAMEDRTRLTELSGAVARLEDELRRQR